MRGRLVVIVQVMEEQKEFGMYKDQVRRNILEFSRFMNSHGLYMSVCAFMHVIMYACMYCICLCMNACIFMYVCMYCMYVYLYVCMYVSTYTFNIHYIFDCCRERGGGARFSFTIRSPYSMYLTVPAYCVMNTLGNLWGSGESST